MLISFQAALTNSEICTLNKILVQFLKAALQVCYNQHRAENWHTPKWNLGGRMFIKERPQDQHLWKRGDQSRSGQREKWTWVQAQPQPWRTHKDLWLWSITGCGPLGRCVILERQLSEAEAIPNAYNLYAEKQPLRQGLACGISYLRINNVSLPWNLFMKQTHRATLSNYLQESL